MNPVNESINPDVGDAFEGGFFAGCLRVGADIFALIAAPKEKGETRAAWLPSYTDVPGARSRNDGAANTVAMSEAGSPAAKWAQALSIDGHTDWYVPSRDELEMLYRAFKPTLEQNSVYKNGTNPSSVPRGEEYTEAEPGRTALTAFQEGGAEAFEDAWYWSSTQSSAYYAWYQDFDDGDQHYHPKNYEGPVRAVRRFKLNP